MDQLDHEFIGRGDSNVESIRLQEMYEKNLTPEELNRMKKIAPFVEEFFVLDYKGKTGEFPKTDRQTPIDQVPDDQQMDMEDYARMQGIDEGHIEDVMTELGGSRESIIPDRNSPLPTPSNNINNTIPPQAAAQEQPSVRTEERQQLRTGVDDLEKISGVETQGMVQGMPPVQETLPGAQSGIVQDLNDPAASPVGDTVPMDNVEEGSAVINSAAVKIIGLKDLLKAREEAREILRAQGKTVDEGKSYKGDGVDVALSNGEFIFTKAEAEVIGQETIDKWNRKGQEDTERAIAQEEGQPVQNPNQVGVQPVMGARVGDNYIEPPPKRPEIPKKHGELFEHQFPAEFAANKDMDPYYYDNFHYTKGILKDQHASYNTAHGMPMDLERNTWLAAMTAFSERDPEANEAIFHVIKNRAQANRAGVEGTQGWSSLEKQIINNEWSGMSDARRMKKEKFPAPNIEKQEYRREFMNSDRLGLYRTAQRILEGPSGDDPTGGSLFFLSEKMVDKETGAPKPSKNEGQNYFYTLYQSGKLHTPTKVGQHYFYRYTPKE